MSGNSSLRSVTSGSATSVVLLVLSALFGACSPRIDEGQFRCNPLRAGSCPPGYSCLLREGTAERHCYREEGEYCGNGVAGALEDCDGHDLAGRTCRDHGLFRGDLRCDGNCRIDSTRCVGINSLSLGVYASCGVDEEGQVWCWGADGDGLVPGISQTPKAVDSDHTFEQVVVGAWFACALDGERKAWCWGQNPGNGGVGQVPRPVLTDGDHTFVSLESGYSHVCGLDDQGDVWCWGDNRVGQTGSPVVSPSARMLYPWRVMLERRIRKVSAGDTHSCAIDEDGQAWCWGHINTQQLVAGGSGVDVGDATYLPVPVAMPVDATFVDIAAGDSHTCALDPSGQTWCWGHDGGVELVIPSEVVSATPVAVQPHLALTAVYAGAALTCGIDAQQDAWCWSRSSDTPWPVLEGAPLTHLTLGKIAETVCGITEDGGAVCEGWNGSWIMSVPVEANVPREVEPTLGFASFWPGMFLGCGWDADRQVHCLGRVLLGDGRVHLREGAGPVPVSGLPTAAMLDVAGGTACALVGEGQAWCWGNNNVGQLGNGSFDATLVPTPVASEYSFELLDVGGWTTCGLTAGGQAWCWGQNDRGQLGNDSFDNSPVPVAVAGGPFTDIAAATGLVSCGIVGGKGFCWGSNECGGLGTQSVADYSLTPTPVDHPGGLTKIVTTSCGGCALDDQGQAWCWGGGKFGPIGDGHFDSVSWPVPVTGEHSFKALYASSYYACGLEHDGLAWCWGDNRAGQLGDGTYEHRAVPTAVSGDHRFESLALSDSQMCGTDTTGGIWCWGLNSNGQLPLDDYVDQPTLLSSPVE